MANQQTKSERLVARTTPEEKALIARAAALRGRTITDFMVDAAQSAARQIVAEETIIRLSIEGQIALANALAGPSEPNEALRDAFETYRKADIVSR